MTSCGDTSPTQPVTYSPVGTWQYTQNVDVDGILVVIVVTFTVAQNNTYQAISLLSDGSTTITDHQEQGTWSITDNRVTFIPSSCKDYDYALQSLLISSCPNTSVFIINSTSMSDGTITMKK